MALVRMFHFDCDNCGDTTSDDWYASTARYLALGDGWHIRGNVAVCAGCWAAGVRYSTAGV